MRAASSLLRPLLEGVHSPFFFLFVSHSKTREDLGSKIKEQIVYNLSIAHINRSTLLAKPAFCIKKIILMLYK